MKNKVPYILFEKYQELRTMMERLDYFSDPYSDMSDIEKSKLLVELTPMVALLNKRLEEDTAKAEQREKALAVKSASNEKVLADMSPSSRSFSESFRRRIRLSPNLKTLLRLLRNRMQFCQCGNESRTKSFLDPGA